MANAPDGRVIDDGKFLAFLESCYDTGRANQSVEIDPMQHSRKDLREVWATVARYIEGKSLEEGSAAADGLGNLIVTNICHQTVQDKIPRLTEMRPRIEVMAKHPFFYPEAQAIQALLGWSWDVENMDLLLERVLSNTLRYRVGIIKVHWDLKRNYPLGLPLTTLVWPHHFLISPGATDESDGDWYIHAEPTPVYRARRMFPANATQLHAESGYDSMSSGLAPTVYGSAGSYTMDNTAAYGSKAAGGGGRSGGVVIKECWLTAPVLEDFGLTGDYWADGGVAYHACSTLLGVRRNPFSKEEIQETLDEETGETVVSGGGSGEFPFVRFVCYDNGTFYGDQSDVEVIIPKQDEIHRTLNQLRDFHDLNVVYLGLQKGALDPRQEDDLQNFPGVVIKVETDVPVRDAFEVHMPTPVGSDLLADYQRQKEDVQGLTGLYAPYTGGSSFAGESGKHAGEVKESADSRVRRQIRNLEVSIERWARLRLATLAQNMTQDEVFEITTSSGQPAFFQFSAMRDGSNAPYFDPTVAIAAAQMGVEVVQLSRDALRKEYRIDVKAGAGMPLDPERRMQKYIALGAAGYVDQQAVLENLNIPDAPQIMERMRAAEAAKMQMQIMLGGASAQAGGGNGTGPPGGGGPANQGVTKPREPRQVLRDETRNPEARRIGANR